jgi:hypothetical protein
LCRCQVTFCRPVKRYDLPLDASNIGGPPAFSKDNLMTKDTQTGTNREDLPAAQLRTREDRELDVTAEEKRLKTALFAALGRTGLNLKEIAETCGLENANLLYNLKNGHSKKLTVQTYITLSRKLNLPISDLLGMPGPASAAPAYVRGTASLQIAAERLARSFAYVRTATEQFYERHLGPERPAFDQTKIDLVASYVRIDCGLEAVAQDAAELLARLREFAPDLPPFTPK